MASNGWCKKGVQCVNELLSSHVRQYSALFSGQLTFRIAWTWHFVTSDMRRHRKTLTYLRPAYVSVYRYSLEVFPVSRNLYRWRINWRFWLAIVTENELGLAFPPRNLSEKFRPDQSTFYLIIVVTDRQTDRQTYACDYIIPRESFRGDNNQEATTLGCQTVHYWQYCMRLSYG